MPVATFDTLKSSKALREAGVPEKQADAQVAILAEAFSVNLKELTTNDDLKNLEERIDYKFREAEQRRKADHDALLAKMASDTYFNRWLMGAVFTALIGIFVRLLFLPMR